MCAGLQPALLHPAQIAGKQAGVLQIHCSDNLSGLSIKSSSSCFSPSFAFDPALAGNTRESPLSIAA